MCSKATWYRHNKKRRCYNAGYTSDTGAGTGSNPTPMAASHPSSDIYVKELSPGDIDHQDTIKRVSEVGPVSVVH